MLLVLITTTLLCILAIIIFYYIVTTTIKDKKDCYTKTRLLLELKKAANKTKNKCIYITLCNYINTIQDLDESEIDFDWYYKRLNEFSL